jgi:hypothetical protein
MTGPLGVLLTRGWIDMAFKDGFNKLAGLNSHKLEQAGLGALALAPAYHTYKAIKAKKPGEAAIGASEVGGLGILSRAAYKAHKGL